MQLDFTIIAFKWSGKTTKKTPLKPGKVPTGRPKSSLRLIPA
ncbi:hypothetical protein PLANPX_4413 [Lacipirellula parvula]|uniref:Uncharacterized protein n=1 Tax=Lacipirellula parvula TaxID=2650471 RepID=A0A5K7XIK9_9BACT|nr:hypothetical protein PLANPX_4413 [Lacipirellula parvula]